MNFQQLEYVIAVHEQKQFSRAADTCHITQATLSSMIKKLEGELNTVLFDRSRQPVVTTEEGL
ncbi:MAG: LysR family transcriptional regulator, partial [Flavobacteriales bacterium]